MKGKVVIRRSEERFYEDMGWLKSKFTFSFANYFDVKFMNFCSLRVINEDVFEPTLIGFGLHPHKNVEIISYVISGNLTHESSMGNEVMTEGTFQVISSGSGIVHDVINKEKTDAKMLQIWITSNVLGGSPSCSLYKPDYLEKWALIVSENGSLNSIQIRQNARIYAIESGALNTILMPSLTFENIWIQVAEGSIEINNIRLNQGDAIGVYKEDIENFKAIKFNEKSKIILFDLQ